MFVETIRSPEVVQLSPTLRVQNTAVEMAARTNPAATAAPVEALESGKAVTAAAPTAESVSGHNVGQGAAENPTLDLQFVHESIRALGLAGDTRETSDESKTRQQVSKRRLEEADRSFKKILGEQFNIFVDEPTGQIGMRVIDKQTGKVLRQIPPEALLELNARLHDSIGAFLDQQS